MKVLFLAVPLLSALLAGCGGKPVCDDCCEDAADCPYPPLMTGYSSPDDPMPVEAEDGHSHRDPEQHKFARNATLVAWDDLRRFGWNPESVIGAHALAVRGDLLAVAVNGGEADSGQQGFHLYDISEPAAPVHLSFYDAGIRLNGDRTIAISEDGETVFLGYEGAGVRPGVAAVDVSDRLAPKEVAFWDDPQDFGSHTISAGTIDGVQYVFSLAFGVNILRYDDSGFQMVGKYVTNDALSILEAPGSSSGPQTFGLRSLYGHDMEFFQDPATGLPLLLVAYAYDGAKVLDLTVPSVPILLARWLPPKDSTHAHYTHSVDAERLPDGRLLLVVGSETFETENQPIASPVWILDATDAVASPPLVADPVHLGTWRNPGMAPAGALGSSVHFFRLQDGLLYLSHYHGGLWGIDLRTESAQSEPKAFAYILPIPPNATGPPDACCIGFDLDGAPMVFDVEVGPGGIVYGADIMQGLTVSRFELPE